MVIAAEALALKVVLEELRLAVRMVGEEETEEALVAPMDLLALLEHFRPVPQGLLAVVEVVRPEVEVTAIIPTVLMAVVTYAVAMVLQEV